MTRTEFLRDLITVAGLALVIYGLHEIYEPFGPLAAGAMLLALTLTSVPARRKGERR